MVLTMTVYVLPIRRNRNVSIGGGFLEAVIHPDVIDGDREYGITGLAFCGADLSASSIVIPPDVTADSDIEKMIIQVRRWHLISTLG